MVTAKPESSVMNVYRLLLATVIALDLSACVESRTPLVTQAEPAVGRDRGVPTGEGKRQAALSARLEVALYEPPTYRQIVSKLSVVPQHRAAIISTERSDQRLLACRVAAW
jgi:hypothetical protein